MYNINLVGVSTEQESLLPLFEDFMSANQVRNFPSKTTIIREGQADNNLYIIKSGILKAGISNEASKINLDFLTTGDIFGISLQSKVELQTYFVETIVDSEVFICEQYKLKELSGLIPEINATIRNLYSFWIKGVLDRFKAIAFLNPKQRVIDWFKLCLREKKYYRIDILHKVSLKDMAEFCAIPFVDFLSILKSLESEGYIELKSNTILRIKPEYF